MTCHAFLEAPRHRSLTLAALTLMCLGAFGLGACSSGAGGASDGSGSGSGSSGGGDGGKTDGAGSVGFDQFQLHNLEVINTYRATLKVAPLALDEKMSTFALAGTQELTMNHTPHQHFITAANDGSIFNSGFNSMVGENQGDPNGWTILAADPTTNEMLQIDAIQKQMFDEGPGPGEAHGHYTNMMNAQYTRVGIGLIEVQGQLYLTNDFSN